MEKLAAIALLLVCLECGRKSQSAARVEATRDQCASYLAATACDRYDDCQGFDSAKAFQTRDACESEYKTRALRYWPSDTCETASIDPDKFETCLSKLMTTSCAKDFWDSVTRVAECRANVVCTGGRETPAPPPEPVAAN